MKKILCRALLSCGSLLLGSVSYGEQLPTPEVSGNTTRWNFEQNSQFRHEISPGFYFNNGTFPTVHMGFKCGPPSEGYSCRRQVFDNGRCILKTLPLGTAHSGFINLRIQYTANALRRGWDPDDVAWSPVLKVHLTGRQTFWSADDLVLGDSFSYTHDVRVKDLNYHLDMEEHANGEKTMRFSSFGVSDAPLGELQEIYFNGMVDNLQVAICAVQSTLLGIRNIQITVIQDL